MAPDADDLELLRRAIALGRRGFFGVEPNPPVGCVITAAGEGVVGEGWHAAYGGPHAEIAALGEAGDRARAATVYLSLAPCGHQGKTPPCAEALIAAGVSRVVYALEDTHPAERGAGVRRLREAGVAVEGPVTEVAADAEALLERSRRAVDRDRPWTFCKWAMSADGSISPRRGIGGRISGTEAGRRTHAWRGHADAVAVGVGTVLTDDPQLTCRLEGGVPAGRRQPSRVVFDTMLRTSPTARLFDDVETAPVWILASAQVDGDHRRAVEDAGARVLPVPASEWGLDPKAALAALYEAGVRRLLVEGGSRIHGALFRGGLVDQVAVFIAPRVLGGREAVPAVFGTGFESVEAAPILEDVSWERVGDDLLLQGYVEA